VREDERFVRDGNDLVSVVDVSAPAAALGTSVTVPTLEGEERVEIEPGTQPGTVISLPGLGMPSLRRGRPGDQRVVVNVVVPRRLSPSQRELLEELSGSLEEHNLAAPDEREHESLFARVRRALG
jgi:molecular chaperone DnaJ